MTTSSSPSQKPHRPPSWLDFFSWALPQLGLRPAGFRRVRRQVEKRIARRIKELGLNSLSDYRVHLSATPDEWRELEAMSRVTISRFWRDKRVFELLADDVLPTLSADARSVGAKQVRAWSAGCGAGEEVYSLALAWRSRAERHPGVELRVIGTDAHSGQIDRARVGVYSAGTLRDLPYELVELGFVQSNGNFRVRDELRRSIELLIGDLRDPGPTGPFDLILCRNSIHTYFEASNRETAARSIIDRLRPGGIYVIGKRESLEPSESAGLTELWPNQRIYQRRS